MAPQLLKLVGFVVGVANPDIALQFKPFPEFARNRKRSRLAQEVPQAWKTDRPWIMRPLNRQVAAGGVRSDAGVPPRRAAIL